VRRADRIINEVIARAWEIWKWILRVDEAARGLALALQRDAVLRKGLPRIRAGIVGERIEDRPPQLSKIPFAHSLCRHCQDKSLTLADSTPLVIAKPEGSIRLDRPSGSEPELV